MGFSVAFTSYPLPFFRYMERGQWEGKFSIIPFYLSVCETVCIQGYPLQDLRWFDIGKPETLAKAEEYYR